MQACGRGPTNVEEGRQFWHNQMYAIGRCCIHYERRKHTCISRTDSLCAYVMPSPQLRLPMKPHHPRLHPSTGIHRAGHTLSISSSIHPVRINVFSCSLRRNYQPCRNISWLICRDVSPHSIAAEYDDVALILTFQASILH
jgi:hypothetical protein